MFSIKERVKPIGHLPPWIQIHLFDNLVRPILLYGSDVWGVNESANMPIDKLLFHYMRCVLHVKSTKSNGIVAWVCGQLPPSVYCHINALCYLNRLSDSRIQKLPNRYITNWTNYTNVVWKHGSPKHVNWPNNTRSIFHLIFIILKNTVRSRHQTVINTDGNWRLQILTETQYYGHIQCSKRNSASRNTLRL